MPVSSVRRTAHGTRQQHVSDRLSETDEQQLVVAFTAGTSKRKLAERYGISESSVKRLIRQHGASKSSNGALSSAFTRGIVTSPPDGGTAEEGNLHFAVTSFRLVAQ
jgi:FixJ family two-component response regulator